MHRMARPPLPWDPSDTRGIDADPSCLHHALALAYHFHLLISYYSMSPSAGRTCLAMRVSSALHRCWARLRAILISAPGVAGRYARRR